MNSKFPLLFCLILLCTPHLHAQKFSDIIDLSSEDFSAKHYIITKINEKVIIDGLADEPCWKQTFFTDSFIDIEGIKKPKFDTKVKMVWDEKFLYIYAQMHEPHIWGNLTKRDTIIYHNNDFEVFIDPSMSTHNYGEIEINALGTVWDLYLDKPYRVGGKANNNWNIEGLKTGIKVHGTLNNPHDIDSLWTVEMAIPIKVLMELKGRPNHLPKEGEQWRINFSRVNWDHDTIDGMYKRKKIDGNLVNEYNWVWSNQQAINMHIPERWGVVQFTHASKSDDIEFKVDKHYITKQAAYALFRKTRFGPMRPLLVEEPGYSQEFLIEGIGNNQINVTFHKTHFGFEYKIGSSRSKLIFVINEQGLLKRSK